MPMRKVSVELPTEMKQSLQAIALQRGISLSAVIRDALAEHFERKPDVRWPRSSGIASDGIFDPTDDERYLAARWEFGRHEST